MKVKNMKIVYFLAGILLLAGCQAPSKEPKQEHAQQALKVEVIQPEKLHPSFTLKLPGALEPNESLDVYAKVKGFVKRIHVDVGDKVRKGQVLATLEAPEMDLQSTADLARSQQLEANLAVSKQRYERIRKVSQHQPGAVSALELEQAYGNLLRDSAAVQESRFSHRKTAQLREYLVVRAPFSGIITSRNYAIGALIGDTGIPFFRLVENDRLKLKVTVPEVHAQAISDSTKAVFSVLGLPESSFEARVKRNAKVIDPVTKALALEFEIPNQDGRLSGGDYADVKLHLKRDRPTFFVPQQSVMHSQSGIFVLGLNDRQEVQRIPVKIGQELEGMVEIFANLTGEEVLLKKASEEIINGQKVQILK